jgi:hypothetical protein
MRELTGMPELTWGDTVRVQGGALPSGCPAALGEIVGIREIENLAQADQFSAPIGSKVYLIEFSDGKALEVPESWVEASSG